MATPPPALADPDELHPKLRAFVSELEEWATLNAQDVKNDTFRFWAFKLPAVLSSACAGVLAVTHFNTLAAVLAALASASILIDAVNPGGQLRNAHLRAVHDLRSLQHRIVTDWRIGIIENKSAASLAAEILRSAEEARAKVEADLRAAETSFARAVDTK
jgi:hypothetical protein